MTCDVFAEFPATNIMKCQYESFMDRWTVNKDNREAMQQANETSISMLHGNKTIDI